MALTDITRREVEKAIEEYDRLGRDTFLRAYGFRRARHYLLLHEGRPYDSKAIIGAAHGHVPGQSPLPARDFSGGAAHAAALLENLGFAVVADLPAPAPSQADLLHRVTHLKVNRSSGHPALYQPITLLWSMGRALRAEPRLLPWVETERALRTLLERHGTRGERPRPDYPVASLHRAGIWTLQDYEGTVPTAHGDAEPLRWFTANQPRGGLAEPLHTLFRHSTATRLAVLDDLLSTYFDDLDPGPLLADVGLTDSATGTEPEEWLMTAAEYERGCRLIEEREAKTDPERVPRTTQASRRSRAARYLVLRRSRGNCENPHCTGQPADVTDRHLPILEIDHVLDLALGGRDHPNQMIALCPNCHAIKTRGSTRDALRETLLKVARQRHETYGTDSFPH